MPKVRQALIEFEELSAAQECVTAASVKPIFVKGRPAYFNFSKSQEIKRPEFATLDESAPAKKIILITVLNPLFPITTEVIHTICSKHGNVERIVMVRKNGVQAFVEYDRPESAQRALVQLNGADIYANCCTLKIEYAKCDRLNVRANSEDMRDYTGASLPDRYGQQAEAPPPAHDYGAPHGAPAYPPPPPGGAYPPYGPPAPYGASYPPVASPYPSPYPPPPPQYDPYGMPPPAPGYPGYPPAGGLSPVVMIYGPSLERLNCSHIFNLLCLYGNVAKIKMLGRQPPSAMAQMVDSYGVQSVIENLNGVELFGARLDFSPSRQPYIGDSRGPVPPLPDGSPSQTDYGSSVLNRFKGPSRHRPAHPGRFVHFYNAAPGNTAMAIEEILTRLQLQLPISIKVFQKEGARSESGLIEFPTVSSATEAIVLANHMEMAGPPSPTGPVTKYTLKLCFSSQGAES